VAGSGIRFSVNFANRQMPGGLRRRSGLLLSVVIIIFDVIRRLVNAPT
jgi:hypothetical protein